MLIVGVGLRGGRCEEGGRGGGEGDVRAADCRNSVEGLGEAVVHGVDLSRVTCDV